MINTLKTISSNTRHKKATRRQPEVRLTLFPFYVSSCPCTEQLWRLTALSNSLCFCLYFWLPTIPFSLAHWIIIFSLSSLHPTPTITVLCTSSTSTRSFPQKWRVRGEGQWEKKVEHHVLLNTKAHHAIISNKVLFTMLVSVPFLVIFEVYQLLWALLSTQIMLSLTHPQWCNKLFLIHIVSHT